MGGVFFPFGRAVLGVCMGSVCGVTVAPFPVRARARRGAVEWEKDLNEMKGRGLSPVRPRRVGFVCVCTHTLTLTQ